MSTSTPLGTPRPPNPPKTSRDAKAQIKAAKIAARSAKYTTKLVALTAIATAIISSGGTYLTIYLAARHGQQAPSDSRIALSSKLILGLFGPANGNSVVGETVVLEGKVYGLKKGLMIWTFNEPKGSGVIYPNNGPCPTSGVTWTCTVDIGGKLTARNGRQVLGNYNIWAAVVDERDANDIVTHLRCFPSGRPTWMKNGAPISGATIEAICPMTYNRQTVPDFDIIPPRRIQVTRLH